MKRPILLLVLLTLLQVRQVSGQDFLSWQLHDRYFSVQAGIGFSEYFGELSHSFHLKDQVSSLNLGVEARLWSKVGARLEVARHTLSGSDANAPDSSFARQRNLSFEATNWEVSLQGIFYMRKYAGKYHKRWQLDPYLMAGVGATFIRPTAELGGNRFPLYELQTEADSYSRFTVIIPVGAGVKFRLNPFLNLIAEITYRYTFSDHLDDVSGYYPQEYPDATSELLSNRKDEIPVVNQEAYDELIAGGRRGDPSNNDSYLILNLKLEMFIPRRLFSGQKR